MAHDVQGMFAGTLLLSCWCMGLVSVIQIGRSADTVQNEGILVLGIPVVDGILEGYYSVD